MSTRTTEPDLEDIAGAVKPLLPPGFRAFLFGSRASGRARPGSDWDVGLLGPEPPAFDPVHPELMLRTVDDTISADVLVVGPEAGRSPSATSLKSSANGGIRAVHFVAQQGTPLNHA